MKTRTYWEALAERWAKLPRQQLWRRHSDAVSARLVTSWLPAASSGRLLKTDAFDEAVSEGLGSSLATLCGEIVAMDLAQATLRAARPRLGDRLIQADARAMPFATGSFDTVVSLSTLDHFESEAELLSAFAELRRICSPGARIVLTLDNPANPLICLRGLLPVRWLSRIGLVPYFVGSNLGVRRLRAALASIGFEVESTSAVVHVPRVIAVAASGWIERRGSENLARRWLRLLMGFERLEGWPTRFLTGHFVAISARVPTGDAAPQPADRTG